MWKTALLFLLLFIGGIQVSAAQNKHPHYVFTLPDGYVGWIQVIFDDPDAPRLPVKNGGHLIEVPESGIPRTSDFRVQDFESKDEFYYRPTSPSGSVKLRTVPSDYVMTDNSHGGFSAMDTGGKGQGSSWFIFIGPP